MYGFVADFGIFLSTPSARRATQAHQAEHREQSISIHALREEGDERAVSHRHENGYFYPRPPRGGRRFRDQNVDNPAVFLSTPSARRATSCALPPCLLVRYFYPRPPRGGRPLFACPRPLFGKFLSTPSARRATIPAARVVLDDPDFYPRPPRGGRLPHISSFVKRFLFLSTPSARRATL